MMRYVITELEKQRGVPAENIYLSMERNMKCAVGFCGHCQLGPHFICKDGPVFSYDRLRNLMGKYEL
jgi:NAD(P)H-flavin reductase